MVVFDASARIANVGRACLRRSYRATLAWRTIRTRSAMRRTIGDHPVLVFQMGKVGSTAVTASLAPVIEPRRAVHVHTLSPQGVAAADEYYRERFAASGRVDRHFLRSRYLARRFEAMRADGGLDIITVVREPVGRNLSAFFQTLPIDEPQLDARLREHPTSSAVIDDVRVAFQERGWVTDPFGWFGRELEPVTGIDVVREEFDHRQGYAIYRRDDVRLLVLRFEDLHRTFCRATEELLGVPDVTLVAKNEGGSKYYSTAYEQLRSDPRLPAELVDAEYRSPVVRHLYTADEIDAFRRRWLSSRSAPERVR